MKVLAYLACVVSLAVAGCGGSTPEKFERIPLASVYSTSTQKGLQEWSLGGELDEDLVVRFNRLFPQASNIFLSIVPDSKGAFRAALRFDGRSEVVLPRPGNKSQLWLIAFLGFGSSSPPRWNLDRVEYSPSKVRVTYSPATNVILRTRDSHPFFYCVPLPEPRPGTYDLELFDGAAREVTLRRKVRLTAAEQ